VRLELHLGVILKSLGTHSLQLLMITNRGHEGMARRAAGPFAPIINGAVSCTPRGRTSATSNGYAVLHSFDRSLDPDRLLGDPLRIHAETAEEDR